MTALLTLVLVLVAGEPTELEGTWHGTGTSDRYTATFAGDELVIRVGTHAGLEPRKSKFTIDAKAGTIDIERSDGKQLGRYEIKDGKLTMMLANVDLPRPDSLDFPTPAKQASMQSTGKVIKSTRRPPSRSRYVFERAK